MAKVDDIKKLASDLNAAAASSVLLIGIQRLCSIEESGTIVLHGGGYSKEDAIKIANWILDVCLD